MTFEFLKNIIEENRIPANAKLMSDSGWECDATNMDGVFYNCDENLIVFTQDPVYVEDCYKKAPWRKLI